MAVASFLATSISRIVATASVSAVETGSVSLACRK
jgi:hypothetical protein